MWERRCCFGVLFLILSGRSDKNAEVEVPEEFKGAECLITNLGRKEFDGKIILNPYEAFVLYYKHQVTEK